MAERSAPTTAANSKDVAVAKIQTDLKNGNKPDKSWSVYILRCADDTLYTGITNDLARRCDQHNAGTASRYTRSRLPVVMVYQEVQASRSLALKRELAIKKLSRRKKELLIQGNHSSTISSICSSSSVS